MAKCIMIGCDLHDKSMLLKIVSDRDKPALRSWGTDGRARRAMIADLQRRAAQAGAGRIVMAYEACGFGFGLHDELTAAGIEAYVLAPSKMARSPKHRRGKTDEKDAQAILDIVRSYVLAGVEMPSVWVPDLLTRDDRELVRRRLTVAEDCSKAMVRIRWLLKRVEVGAAPAEAWTKEYWLWLEMLVREKLPSGTAAGLASLMRQVAWLDEEIDRLDQQVIALSRTARYAPLVAGVRRLKGVGVLTAMVFLSEIGDMDRFANRRQVGAYLGLVPSCSESGEGDDHKGHITHQGPSRVRKVLCQAVWSRLRTEPWERAAYDRLVRRNPKHKKIAVVARMRALGVVLWHEARTAQRALAAPQAAASPAATTRWDPGVGNRPPCAGPAAGKQKRRPDPIAPAPIDLPLGGTDE
ncbi:MAG: IS110 family transposase [bacterium]